MITTVTLNPALDKLYFITDFKINRLHRLGDFSKLLIEGEIDTVVASPGGKGINVGIFTQRMGIETMAMGIIGGHTGRIVEELVRKEGLTINFVYGIGLTRTNLNIYDSKNNTLTEINEPGNPVLEEDLDTFLKRYSLVLGSSEYIVISGSIPQGTNPDFYYTLIDMANSRKVPVILNSSKTPLIKGIEAGPMVVYPDLRSSYSLLNHKTETREDYLDLGHIILDKHKNIKIVMFSNIIKGKIYFVSTEGSYEVTMKDLRIANLLGFGDQLVGGLVYALVNKKPMPEIIQLASAAGLANVESMSKFVTNMRVINQNMNRIEINKLE